MSEQRVREVMASVFGIPAASIPADASADSIEQWDSLGHMNLCLAIEEEFGVSLDGAQVAAMTSFASIMEAVGSPRRA